MSEIIKDVDYFASTKDDFYKPFHHKSYLVQGKHWEQNPFVTILLTTYKRPQLLKQSLESALKQKGFNDYQIIVVDNEGEDITKETETSKLLGNYKSDKVIYYRHECSLDLIRENAAVRLARSPWIVFLHDDDLLAENHLAVMTEIIKKYNEIKFLGCPTKDFMKDSEIEVQADENGEIYRYKIQKYLKNATCLGRWSGWTGALISRRHYIAIGGMLPLALGCGDKIMVCVFQHHYGTYCCVSDRPLYYYRRGEQQVSFSYRDDWENLFINEYFFYKYVIRKYHKITYKIWERYSAYYILNRCRSYNEGIYHTQIDIERVISECNLPGGIRRKGFLYYITQIIFYIYRKTIGCVDFINTKVIGKSDMHIVV